MSRACDLLAASLATALATSAATAAAWAPIASSRPVWSGPAPYELNAAGSPDLGGFGPTEAEVRRGMDDWTTPSCSGLVTTYGGSTTRRPTTYDGHSTIGWVESGWRFDSNAIGVTQPQFSPGRIHEADMSMNGQHYTWITGPGSGSSVNAYSIVLHEGGHYVGLDHSSDRSAIMYFAYSGGIGAIGADDTAGICALYPGGGSADCTTTGCPSGYECVSGTCRRTMPPAGGGAMCAPCGSGADCANGVCLRYPDGGTYCGADCSSSADCAPGDRCVAVSGAGNQCVRGPVGRETCATAPAGCTSDAQCASGQRCNVATGACEALPTGSGALGASCAVAGDCASGLCIAGRCSQTCNWLDTRSCPGGFYCNGMATGTCDQGLCVPGSAGSAPIGAACRASTECESLLCDRGICTTPCIPGGAVGCGAGYACQAGTSPGCGSCQQAGAMGDMCTSSADCLSGLCAMQGGGSFCTALCDATSPCPRGFGCAPVDERTSVCVPEAGSAGLGASCTSNEACASDVCVSQGERSYCTRFCGASDPCPRDYACVALEGDPRSICQPTASRRRGASGCSAAPGAGGTAGWTAASLLGLAWLSRRRARRRGRQPDVTL
jgi:uncharacterized protein (TIGR03382 family)